jgi:lipid-A-disaccharide synthase
MKEYTVFLIAGEASGDLLGSRLMKALKQAPNCNFKFIGVGGERMTEEGLESLFPMHELSVMGFVEVIPHLPKLIKLINYTADEIKRINPDIVITIDSPDFCFRVAKKLQNTNIKLVHYVAPSVWAYRPGRARKVAKLYDHLLTLLPFEPIYFEREGLKSTFVGHPIVEEVQLGNRKEFRSQYKLTDRETLLCMLPGSRAGEIKRMLPIFLEATRLTSKIIPNLVLAISTIPSTNDLVKEIIQDFPLKTLIINDIEEKKHLYAGADIALAKSGTGTLELALAGLPMIVTYKINPVSAFFLKPFFKVPYVNLINIIQNKQVIPEMLQDMCKAEILSNNIKRIINNKELQQKQRDTSKQVFIKLGMNLKPSPSEKAAKVIIELIES